MDKKSVWWNDTELTKNKPEFTDFYLEFPKLSFFAIKLKSGLTWRLSLIIDMTSNAPIMICKVCGLPNCVTIQQKAYRVKINYS